MRRKDNLAQLITEQRNPASHELDLLPAFEIARLINAEDAKVATAVQTALPQVARGIEAIGHALASGGRLIYVGTGTSGRLGALEAAECPPTFNTDAKMIQFIIGGGVKALAAAVEASEDARRTGQKDMAKRRPSKRDVVVGVAASGRTPYTVAALQYARQQGAVTIAVTCNQGSPLGKVAHIAIVAEVGPEILTGSTRMKAATAQKMILNMLTTGAMARLGYVYGNLMVNVPLKNSKLRERGIGIVQEVSGLDRDAAQKALKQAAGSVPLAIVMTVTGCTRPQAEKRLKAAKGNLRQALAP